MKNEIQKAKINLDDYLLPEKSGIIRDKELVIHYDIGHMTTDELLRTKELIEKRLIEILGS